MIADAELRVVTLFVKCGSDSSGVADARMRRVHVVPTLTADIGVTFPKIGPLTRRTPVRAGPRQMPEEVPWPRSSSGRRP